MRFWVWNCDKNTTVTFNKQHSTENFARSQEILCNSPQKDKKNACMREISHASVVVFDRLFNQ